MQVETETPSENNYLTSKYWSEVDCSASDRNFYAFPPIVSRTMDLIFGERGATQRDNSFYWTAEKYLKDRIPFASALSICCGFGSAEREISQLGIAEKITGIDIAPGAIEEAIKRAGAQGLSNIDYQVVDLNSASFPPNFYSLVWSNGALHHIEKLESVLGNLYNSLKSGGVLVATEYIGPKYQQVGKRQGELVNAIRHLLPPELRSENVWAPPSPTTFSANVKKVIKTRLKDRFFQDYLADGDRYYFGKIWNNTPVEWFIENDPSESIRGNEIIPILQQAFDRVEVRPFHGSILFYALGTEFYERFDPANKKHQKLLNMLFDIEDTLIENGEVQNENAHIICWKK